GFWYLQLNQYMDYLLSLNLFESNFIGTQDLVVNKIISDEPDSQNIIYSVALFALRISEGFVNLLLQMS
mgnify:CR=1